MFDKRPGAAAALSEQGQVCTGGAHRPAGAELTGPGERNEDARVRVGSKSCHPSSSLPIPL
jgi:hypothetical protein